ncbi:hypothetical protein MMA231_03470 (plasmid) [Asticcacaulis sp. MM231]|uniref:glycosyltransferase family 2 protein n=1 Tax=Asticcacaulis sp. MM231 TaxID=3157666 RepID=UPI0032D56BF3
MTYSNSSLLAFFWRIFRALSALFKNNFDWRFRGVNHLSQHIHLNRHTFDREYYFAHNPDILEKGVDPFKHYISHGVYENRQARFFDTQWYMKRYPDLRRGRIDAWTHFRELGDKEGRSGQYISLTTTLERPNHNNYKEWISHYDRPGRGDIKYMNKASAKLRLQTFCVCIIDENNDETGLAATLRSVTEQIRPVDEVRVLSRSLRQPLKNETPNLPHIHNTPITETISTELDTILAETRADYMLMVRAGDLLASSAIFWFARETSIAPSLDVIYSDEDVIDQEGTRSAPNFKPEPNKELLLSHNMIGNLTAFSTRVLRKLNGFPDLEVPALEYDLALKVVEQTPPDHIRHVPRILYHARLNLAQTIAPNPSATVVKNHLVRMNKQATVTEAPEAPGHNRVRYDLPEQLPLISIIIPTRDRVDILRICLNSLFELTTYPRLEVIVVDNGSTDQETLAYLEQVQGENGVVILRDDSPFNFSALNNRAVQKAHGDYVCLMNNDIEILTPDWLEEMLSFAHQPEIGCVGARLWYPDDTIQHAGVLIGFHGVAGHMHKALPRGEPGYQKRAILHQSVSAVTAACLLVQKHIYQTVGGLDEELAVAFNDVDFCLKVRAAGYRNVYTPYAEMVHHESASRGTSANPINAARELSEVNIMKKRWTEELKVDPAYNPNLTLVMENLSLAWPPRVTSVAQLRVAAR